MIEWTDFFTCWCKFKKAKSYFNDFWVGVIKNGVFMRPENLLYLNNEFMNWADFLHANCDAIILIRLTLYSVSLTFKMPVYCSCNCWTPSSSQNDPMNEIGCVHSSVLLSVCVFVELDHKGFSGFLYGVRNPYQIVQDSQLLWKNLLYPKNWGNEGKKGFLNLKKNKENKIIRKICCVPAQILCWGKILFLRYRAKCSQPIRLQDFFK